jgi:hypothetical protein
MTQNKVIHPCTKNYQEERKVLARKRGENIAGRKK